MQKKSNPTPLLLIMWFSVTTLICFAAPPLSSPVEVAAQDEFLTNSQPILSMIETHELELPFCCKRARSFALLGMLQMARVRLSFSLNFGMN